MFFSILEWRLFKRKISRQKLIKLDKNNVFIYNILSVENSACRGLQVVERHGSVMFNIYSRKTKKIISAVIIIFLIIAMVLPMALGM